MLGSSPRLQKLGTGKSVFGCEFEFHLTKEVITLPIRRADEIKSWVE